MNTNTKNNKRNIFIDALKGISIIAVVLYHFGGEVLPYGYLGVDVFFVVSGYFLYKNMIPQLIEGRFSYKKYIIKKIVRLYPIIVLLILFSILLGFFLMLPDDYENLSESAIASAFFANNILQCITTKDYWDISNLYKPLMHLWYVGVLMQAYIVIPLLYIIANKFKKKQKCFIVLSICLTILSFVLYVLPFPAEFKFYYLPFRLFELTLGGILVFVNDNKKLSQPTLLSSFAYYFAFFLLIVLFCVRDEIISKEFMLIFTVVASCLLLYILQKNKMYDGLLVFRILAPIGKASYSIYIWHQLIVAFIFYSIVSTHNLHVLLIILPIIIIISFVSHKIIEEKIEKAIVQDKSRFLLLETLFLAFVICSFSLVIYMKAGVVRDVPELDILSNDVHRGMHAEYCDRPYDWDKDFENDSRVKVLVFGNSFGRDWANILYEWDEFKILDISYCYYSYDNMIKRENRVAQADIVFFAQGPRLKDVPEEIIQLVGINRLYIVGNKNYGESNGIIYSHRFFSNYYKQTVVINDELLKKNKEDALSFGNHFIEMMDPVMSDDTHAFVFTDDNHFISQDCRHLTKAGAQYYARILNIKEIFNL